MKRNEKKRLDEMGKREGREKKSEETVKVVLRMEALNAEGD